MAGLDSPPRRSWLRDFTADFVESLCTERIFWIGKDIGNVGRFALERGASGTGVPARANWILLYKFFEFFRSIVGDRHPQRLAIELVNEGSIRSAQPD